MEFWLTQTILGKAVVTFCISMFPVIELRLGLPYGISLGLDYPVALTASVLGNMLPVPFIMLFVRRVFAWLRSKSERWDRFVLRLEDKARRNSVLVHRYSVLGLMLLVAIPLPGTGAWTGALVATMLNMSLRSAVPTIFFGVCIAAAIMTAVTFGVIHTF